VSDQQYKFTLSKGSQPGKIYLLLSDTIIIGRDPMADISLNDPEVSRQHAKLTRTDSGYALEELGSTNGTFINGSQIESNVLTPLVPGQTVALGSGISLVFEEMLPEIVENTLLTSSETVSVEDVFEFEADPPVFANESLDDPLEGLEEVEASGFDDFSELSELDEPAWESSTIPEAKETAAPSTPLVPSGSDDKAKKRRRNVTIAVVSLLLLCCCCLLFLWSAYFYWGDPLLESLGLY